MSSNSKPKLTKTDTEESSELNVISDALKEFVPTIAGSEIAVVATISGMVAYKSLTSLTKLYTKPTQPSAEIKEYWRVPRMNRQIFTGNVNEDKKPAPTSILILYQCPRGRKTPCIGPYPLKLETFLRVHRIAYEVGFDTGAAPKTAGPWVTLNFEDIVDSQNCIKFLCDKLKILPDEHLNEEEKTMARAYNHLCDNHLYWGIALHRWNYDTDSASLRKIQYFYPGNETEVDIPKVRDTINRGAWYHGIGKLPKEKVEREVIADLKSLSKLLGFKNYMLSDETPSELDCTVFGILAQILWTMEETSYYKVITRRHSNLQNFCIRMRDEFWPDWEQCLLNSPVGSDSEIN